MSNTFSVYIAEKPYLDSNLGSEWRKHRFLMLADEKAGAFRPLNGSYYNPVQELHYVWQRHTPCLKAIVYPQGRIVRPQDKITLSGPIENGSEYHIRGAWNRALATGVALNKEDVPFADVKKVSEVSALNTCDAGLQAGLDAMGIMHDFGRSGLFNAALYKKVASQIPELDPSETLEDRRATSIALMKQVNATRKVMKG